MCESPVWAGILKPQYDYKYQKIGKRSQMRIIGSVRQFSVNDVYKILPPDKYNIFMKECGSCMTCRIKQSSQKAGQAYYESLLHQQNSFITLTFGRDDIYKYLTEEKKLSSYKAKKAMHYWTWTLDNKLFSDFMKRLRITLYREKLNQWIKDNNLSHLMVLSNGKVSSSPDYILKKYCLMHLAPKPDCIRTLHCGEYTSNAEVPHHHTIIFGYNPTDIYEEHTTRAGMPYIRKRSKTIDKLWKYGISQVDNVNYHSINYVSRYVTKKIKGSVADEYYAGRKPEYCTSSTSSGGLGKDYFIKNFNEFKSRKKMTVWSSIHKQFIPISLCRYFKELWKRIDIDSYNDYIEQNICKLQFDISKMKSDKLLNEKRQEFTSQQIKTKRVLNDCIRAMERTDSDMLSVFERKCCAFGVSPDVYNSYKDVVGKYINVVSFDQWKRKWKNEKLRQKYDDFEKMRRRLITKSKNTDCSLLYFYEKMKNPYKVKGRCKQVLDIVPTGNYLGFDKNKKEVLIA